MTAPALIDRGSGVLREPWAESLGDPGLIASLEEVLRLLAKGEAEAGNLPSEQRQRAVGRELSWISQWMTGITESWRAAEEIEPWEDRLLTQAEQVSELVEELAVPLLASEPLLAPLGDGLRAWRLWHLGANGRASVVRLLQALEESVERVGAQHDSGVALLGELHAAELALEAAMAELDRMPPHPVVEETSPKLAASIERLRAARSAGAAGARDFREQQASRHQNRTAATEAEDPAVPLPLLALDLLLGEMPPFRSAEARERLAQEILRREEWDDRSLHPQAVASLILGNLYDPERRRETLGRLGREIAAGRAATRLVEQLMPTDASPSFIPEALEILVREGRVESWEAEAYLLVQRRFGG